MGRMSASLRLKLGLVNGRRTKSRQTVERNGPDPKPRPIRVLHNCGDARVPASYIVDDYRLGAWVIKQRATRASGNLDPDRQRRLEDLPAWTWHTKADQWEDGFSRLLDYVRSYGDARVARRSGPTWGAIRHLGGVILAGGTRKVNAMTWCFTCLDDRRILTGDHKTGIARLECGHYTTYHHNDR